MMRGRAAAKIKLDNFRKILASVYKTKQVCFLIAT